MSAHKEHPVLWWIGWIALTILSFFVACWFWTGVIARYVGPMDRPGVPVLWLGAVFGTWMVFLVPLIIVMYNKVDRAYDEGRAKREEQAKKRLSSQFGVQTLAVAGSKLLLPEALRKKLRRMPKTVKGGQLVTLRFRDGSVLENAFVSDHEEIAGVYGRSDFPFDAKDAVSAELLDAGTAMPDDYARWLRLIADDERKG